MCRRRSHQNYRIQTSQTVMGKSNFMCGIRPLPRLGANFPVSLVSFVELSSSIFIWTLYRHVEPCSSRLRHDSNSRTPTFTEYVEMFFWSSKQTETNLRIPRTTTCKKNCLVEVLFLRLKKRWRNSCILKPHCFIPTTESLHGTVFAALA